MDRAEERSGGDADQWVTALLHGGIAATALR